LLCNIHTIECGQDCPPVAIAGVCNVILLPSDSLNRTFGYASAYRVINISMARRSVTSVSGFQARWHVME